MVSFLDLPGEIRNHIYIELLVPNFSIQWRQGGCSTIYPRILEVCRQTHREAQVILYGMNTFSAHPSLLTALPSMKGYYGTIRSQSVISLIRKYHVRVRLDCDPRYSAEKVTNAFTGLEELSVEIYQASFGSSGFDVLKLFEGVRGVKRAIIYGSTSGIQKYAEWLQNAMMAPERHDIEPFDNGTTKDVRSVALEIVCG